MNLFKSVVFILAIAFCSVAQAQSSLVQTPQPEKIILVFGADWCGYCTKMHEDSWPEVQDVIEEGFASIHYINIDLPEGQRLSRGWGVSTLPTVIIAIPSGDGNATTVKRKTGYMGPEELRGWLTE